jgi:CO dehydrogenase/acetyl-CoA synthase alpha subunit
MKNSVGYDDDMASYRKTTEIAEDAVNKNMNELIADRKKISQIMTKVLKQVRDTAKTEQDPAKKKDLLDKAKRASDGWNRKLPVDPKKPLPEPPEQPGAKAKQPKKAQKKKK